jgi:hypothetical protein
MTSYSNSDSSVLLSEHHIYVVSTLLYIQELLQSGRHPETNCPNWNYL